MVGLGKTGLSCLKFLAGHPGCTVEWVSDRPDNWPPPEDLDLLVIASWDQFHAEQVRWGLRHGAAVFCEKPLCLSRFEADEILGAGGRLSMNMVLRARLPALEFKPYRIDAAYNWGRKEKLSGWRGKLNYSPVLGGGIHLLDLMCLYMGPLQEAKSMKRGNTVVSALRFEEGIGTLTSDLDSPPPHSHGFHAWGTDRDFRWDGVPDQPDSVVLDSFVEHLLTGVEPMVTAEDVKRTMDACFIVEDSWR